MTPVLDLTAAGLRELFDRAGGLSVGIEEEVFLLDEQTLDLTPRAAELVERDARFKGELPAAQLEIVTEPARDAVEAIERLGAGRRALVEAARGIARPAATGVHPFAAAEGELSPDPRYDFTRSEYGPVARRQLVGSLQVHLAVGGAERALAVYNALRAHLPDIAALAANAPFHAGADSGLASVRPQICTLLPRQGIPPALGSWEELAAALRALPEPRLWWWELRPHPAWGTLEMRVPDAQTTLADAAGVTAFCEALVATLAGRHDAGERLPVAATWRIAENGWSAARHGLAGTMTDPLTGERERTSERLERLIDEVAPLGSAALLGQARALARQNGAERQRAVAAEAGLKGLATWLCERFA